MSQSDPEAVFQTAPVKKAGWPSPSVGLLLALCDGVLLALLGWILSRTLLPSVPEPDLDLTERALVTGLMLVPLVKSVFGIYSLGRFDYAERTRRTFQAAVLCAAVLMVPFAVMDGVRSFFVQALAIALGGFAVTFLADLLLVHGLLTLVLQWRTPVIIVGAGSVGAAVAEKLHRLPWLGMRAVGFVDDDESLWNTRVAGVPVLGPTSMLQAAPAIAAQAQAAIVADVGRHGADLPGLLKALPFRQVYCVLGNGGVTALDASYQNLHGSLALRVTQRSEATYLRIRRAMDIVLSSLLLVLVAPLMLGIAILIKLDSPGPVMFRQKRWAGGNRTFDVLKFRSMHIDAEEQLKRLLDSDPQMRAEYETFHKLSFDPRITPFGRFLRKTSLDELPQLWNILMGEMSLIGPRAYMPKELPEVGASAAVIGSVRPGLTGYWQVSGRHRTSFQERVAMDVFYVGNRGLVFDLFILFKTAFVVLRGEGS
ncbi:exopolysaccharide biosynthesis polyprenyl glycosylphosphotransferase [Azospirillum sp. TSO22-1]|uniref:exopolysaccharide biosynthesis polyprenyl glycosylphosphotransferase n=1 Tax=Azospirillum sp. TSO22-1 TaxID=716789 RepID=UPI000D612CA0|nr:exopolysaccharide biosynthesis polyprenyl glycosylphosphotransferase [Azospirillum sp. TSO22-1]PWC34828.1 UDP-phosphate galactose phosphotransferase [Azospirillum sp. TSO22-1]